MIVVFVYSPSGNQLNRKPQKTMKDILEIIGGFITLSLMFALWILLPIAFG